MNINTPQKCLEEWEKDFWRTGNDANIPADDRERVLHELDQLYNDAYEVLLFIGVTPNTIEHSFII
jgi:hypothetical protein